jgi:hypothetical protein
VLDDVHASSARYATPVRGLREDDCYFYHVMDVPGQDALGGQFDLRGSEDEYLGNIELAGARVLEIGPASGFLSFHMESKGGPHRLGRARPRCRMGRRPAGGARSRQNP